MPSRARKMTSELVSAASQGLVKSVELGAIKCAPGCHRSLYRTRSRGAHAVNGPQSICNCHTASFLGSVWRLRKLCGSAADQRWRTTWKKLKGQLHSSGSYVKGELERAATGCNAIGIMGSPPCKAYTTLTREGQAVSEPALIGQTRSVFKETGMHHLEA